MKQQSILTILILTLASPAVLAHEGHDHDAPKMIQAPKGGVIKSLEETSVEVVSKGKDLKIYLYNNEMKPQDVSGYKVSATAKLPRTKKIDEVNLLPKGTYFEASYDAKGIHRYTLTVAITDPKTGHPDKLNFTIEPRGK